jgi:hemerythrin superfamily protein
VDAIELLTADHNRVRGLFTRFKAAHEAEDTETCAVLAGQIFTELQVHTTIEEEIFYPETRELSSEISEAIDEGLEEHHVAKTLMEEAAQLDPSDDQWVAKLTVIIESVEHHAEEEETEMFALIRKASDKATREQLAERLEARKLELGAPVLADKIDLSSSELQELAKAQEIPGRSKMSHDELAATVAPD